MNVTFSKKSFYKLLNTYYSLIISFRVKNLPKKSLEKPSFSDRKSSILHLASKTFSARWTFVKFWLIKEEILHK